MSKIYTKTGDAGRTRCLSGIAVNKHSDIIECVGDLDELSAWINYLASGTMGAVSSNDPVLDLIFKDLARAMAAISGRKTAYPSFSPAATLEKYIDAAKLMWVEFVIPNSTEASMFNVVRTVCRRAERHYWKWLNGEGLKDNGIGVYLNRLSDYLFVRMCRAQH